MNKYQGDFYGWTQQQADLLRAGQFAEIDIENLIEEVETMGRSEKRQLDSRLTVLLTHLLKWQYQTDRRGKSWRLTIIAQRDNFSVVLQDNPSLKPQLDAILAHAYKLARVYAARETDLELTVFPESCPWTYAQILDEGFYPE